ncbi:hypothetical protein ACNKHU_03240 [Shigella flexneri]
MRKKTPPARFTTRCNIRRIREIQRHCACQRAGFRPGVNDLEAVVRGGVRTLCRLLKTDAQDVLDIEKDNSCVSKKPVVVNPTIRPAGGDRISAGHHPRSGNRSRFRVFDWYRLGAED